MMATGCRAIVTTGLLVVTPCSIAAQSQTRAATATTRYFVFYNDLATNLNDALMAAGLARRDKKAERFRGGEAGACFEKLAPSVRAGWDEAVDYYSKIISPGEFTGRQQYLVRVHLAGHPLNPKDASARQFVELAAAFRGAAQPAYEACGWPAQQARNQAWIEAIVARLAKSEQPIGARLEQLYQKKIAAPVHVDVVETVSWAGANSIFPDEGSHVLVSSSSNEGPVALESVFHEASHGFMFPGDPLRAALDNASKAAALTGLNDLWHVVLFYTTGEAVRRELEQSGVAGYRPMLYEIFDRGTWTRYRSAVETVWPAYVNGKRPLPESATSLITALAEQSKTR
jgi:hypothetical protein